MSQTKNEAAITALKVVLGVVVIAQAVFLAFVPRTITAFTRTGFPDFVRLILAWSEIAAGILFLIPAKEI
jgi:hypothetical protein